MKNVVITGSSRGLGYEMAACFLQGGNNVTISGSNHGNLHRAAERLTGYGNRVLAVPADVQNYEQLESLWHQSLDHWGSIDIWINNAGISQGGNALWELSSDKTQRVIQTNLLGTIFGSQIAMKGMLLQGDGQIFNMEGFGSNDMIRPGLNLYGTSKRALTHFTKTLAMEAKGTRIKIGTLSPGMMVTEFVTGPADGSQHPIEENTRRIFNMLGDKPDKVASFMVERILNNKKNGAHIVWLTRRKLIFRFIRYCFIKRDLFSA